MEKSFYKTQHAPYYICALDYIQQSAGIRVLHYLCHALNEIGMEAYVTCEGTASHLRTPTLDGTTLQRHHASGRKPIVVYPEIISGDPLSAGGVVARWLLNRPGLIGGDTSFHPDELIFTYDPIYVPAGMKAERLNIPACDLAIFNNDNNPHDAARDLVCFYAHKYLVHGGQLTSHAQGAVSLCKDQNLSHAEIAAILKRAKVLYVYEPTAMLAEALLCGCPVGIIETDYWRANMQGHQWPDDIGFFMVGGKKSLEQATTEIPYYREVYLGAVKTGWEYLQNFVTLTQQVAATK